MNGKRLQPPFDNAMSRNRQLLGWIYLPLHMVALPLLLPVFGAVSPTPLSGGQINLIYYGLSLLVVLAVMLPFLRRNFDNMVDQPLRCVMCMFGAVLADYAMTMLSALVLLLLMPDFEANPNNEATMAMAAQDYGVIKALTIFIEPLVEEVLYRGVAFGSIRSRSRGWAYGVSILLFALSHVWQPLLVTGDLRMLIYCIQYVPVAIVTAWLYESSGTIWTSVFFHMGYNAVSFAALQMLEQL